MTHEPSILERNLVALFARAYVPVHASPAFRAQLAQRLSHEIVRPSAPPSASGVRVWRAAAAVLLLLGAALAAWLVAHGGRVRTETRESLLARGQTALRSGAAADWRALNSVEASRGVELAAGRLELATATASGARVWLSAAGRVDAAPGTALSIETGPDENQHTLELESGSIALERYAPDGRFEISTTEGRVVLERGALALACVTASDLPAGFEPGPAVRARLESGVAWLDTQPGRTLLGRASDVYLRDGRIASAGGPELDGQALAAGATGATGDRQNAPGTPTASAAQAADATPSTPALTGHVRAPDGAPLTERFVLTLLREVRLPDVSRPEPHAFEDAQGAFVVPAVRPGTYRVFVEAHGYAVWQVADVTVAAGGATIELDVALERGTALRGRVVDAKTRGPIEGAVILSETDAPSQILPLACDEEWMQGWLALARSGPDGRFELPALSAGKHMLRATRAGFGASWTKRIDLSAGAVPGEPNEIEIALDAGGTIFGRVAQSDGRPSPGAIVIASHMATDDPRNRMSYGMARADAEGGYTIADLPPGMYVVLYVPEPSGAKSIDPLVIQVNVERGRSTQVNLPGGERGTRLVGHVLTADGKPLADADVMVQPRGSRGPDGWRAERTHAHGDFVFAGLEPDTYQVFVGRGLGQFFVWQADVEVPDAPQHELELRLDAGILAGHVRDATTRSGLARSVLILLVERDREWQFCGRGGSGPDGSFEFPHLRAGNYRIHAYATSGTFGPEHTPDLWVSASDGPRDVELALAPGAALTIRARDPSGKPLARATIALVDSDGQVIQHTQEDVTDAHGELAIPGIRPGRWTVRAECRGTLPVAVAVELTAGEQRLVELVLAPVSQPK